MPMMQTIIGDLGHLTLVRNRLLLYRLAFCRVGWWELVRYQLDRLQRSAPRVELNSIRRYFRNYFLCM